ncbi:MAG: hypothetical protein RL220_1999 [Bacteroidota bacterium]
MSKIRTVIIDDDEYIRRDLGDRLRSVKDVDVIAVIEHPVEALEFLKKHKPDLLFLDIQMPDMNGFELLDEIDTAGLEVIFITAFDQFAIRAIRYSALDYLLKPFDDVELTQALERYRRKADNISVDARLKNLRHNLDVPDHKSQQLVIPTKQGEHYFPVHDIIRCEADSNYTVLYLKGGRKFVASKTLGDIEHMLEKDVFIRVHKSWLVNRQHIEQLTSDEALILSDGSHVEVSRRRLSDVRALLRN